MAFPEKSRVDENYFLLAKEMLLAKKAEPKIRAAFGTHDMVLLRRISEFAAASGLPKTSVEVQMLYGIQSGEQERLAREGYTFKSARVLRQPLVYVVYPAIGGTAGEFVVCGAESFSFPLKIYTPSLIELLQRQFANKIWLPASQKRRVSSCRQFRQRR